MRIALITPTFAGGGAERVATVLSNDWVSKGESVTVITFEAPGTSPGYALNARVSLQHIDAYNRNSGLAARIVTNLNRLARLRRLLKGINADVVVAFTTEANVVTLCAARGLGIPVIISERNQPDRPGLGQFRQAARRLTYPFADVIVMQTQEIARWARQRFKVPVHVLPNPVRLDALNEGVAEEITDRRRIVAAGRLVPQKGFDILIAAFAKIAQQHSEWSMTIYGEGPSRSDLEAQVREAGLQTRVNLPGFSNSIDAALQSAGLFVLPSRYEGYPNILLEALAASCPAVATNCPGGVAEIIGDDEFGMLVPNSDSEALAAALGQMMSRPELRQHYASKARRAVEQLDAVAIGDRWLEVFEGLQEIRRSTHRGWLSSDG
jgi:GalNAc-alpha-(1->4)-GalNAc-alpha-(1->3)-diNAcBac-PP-undecaprenol alpha-1,4-N-acetyl-D-galactosaminyltransferase